MPGHAWTSSGSEILLNKLQTWGEGGGRERGGEGERGEGRGREGTGGGERGRENISSKWPKATISMQYMVSVRSMCD